MERLRSKLNPTIISVDLGSTNSNAIFYNPLKKTLEQDSYIVVHTIQNDVYSALEVAENAAQQVLYPQLQWEI